METSNAVHPTKGEDIFVTLESEILPNLDKVCKLDAPAGPTDKDIDNLIKSRRNLDTIEIIDVLETLRLMFEESKKSYTRMKGKPIYQSDDEFNVVKDIVECLKHHYASGDTDVDTALKRRKYNPIRLCVLEPIVELFKNTEARVIFDTYDIVIDKAIERVFVNNINAHPDDAIVARKALQAQIYQKGMIKRATAEIVRLRSKKKQRRSANVTTT